MLGKLANWCLPGCDITCVQGQERLKKQYICLSFFITDMLQFYDNVLLVIIDNFVDDEKKSLLFHSYRCLIFCTNS